MERLNETFRDNLRYFMELRGKTQADIARALGVSTSAVTYWCSGEKMPRADKLKALCDLLFVDMSDLVEPRAAVPSFEQRLFDEEGIMLRKFGELSDKDKQMVRDLVDRLTSREEDE